MFSSTYAKICQIFLLLTKEVASKANPAETTNFRKLLLTCCQKEFEKGSAGKVADVEIEEMKLAESVRPFDFLLFLSCINVILVF